MQLLLEAGSKSRIDPVHIAAMVGDENRGKTLIEDGAEVDQFPIICTGIPLYLAVENGHEAVVLVLLEAGAHANGSSKKGTRVLTVASRNGHEAIVRALLEAGAVVYNATEHEHESPLRAAAVNGHKEILRALLEVKIEGGTTIESGDDRLENNDGNTFTAHKYIQEATRAACRYGDEEVVRILLRAADVNEDQAHLLYVAAENGHEGVFDLLMTGANVNHENSTGATPLFTAARNGHENVVKKLLDAGATVDKANVRGTSPLIAAARKGHEAVVRILLEAGADCDLQNNDGVTSLWIAARNGHITVIEVLLSIGVDKNKARRDGASPLDAAMRNEISSSEMVIERLRGAGAVSGILMSKVAW